MVLKKPINTLPDFLKKNGKRKEKNFGVFLIILLQESRVEGE